MSQLFLVKDKSPHAAMEKGVRGGKKRLAITSEAG